MKRGPPVVALWCLTRLAGVDRGEALVGDLLERFDEGETRAWFWRQTIATLAFAFFRAVREHGSSFLGALAAAAAVLVVMWFVNPLITSKVLSFQTHQMLEFDPHWTQRFGWGAVFFTLHVLQTCVWFAIAGWLAARIHRAHPRLIIAVCTVLVVAVNMPLLIHQAGNVMTHSRFLPAFIGTLTFTFLAADTVLWCGLWVVRRRMSSWKQDASSSH
jgi:hypothetical protein